MRFSQNHCSRRSREQRGARRQRALARRPELTPTGRAVSEIGQRCDQRRLIVREAAQPEIAFAAEQAADRARRMAMIDAQRLLRRLGADRAHAALPLEQRVVIRP